MNDFELIDTTDNDCHDIGTREEMLSEAKHRQDDDDDYNANKIIARVKPNRWVVKPAGYSDEHYKG